MRENEHRDDNTEINPKTFEKNLRYDFFPSVIDIYTGKSF